MIPAGMSRTAILPDRRSEQGLGGDITRIDRPKRRVTLCFCAAFTPTATGADVAELPVPAAPDGQVLRWRVYRFTLHVTVAGGAPAVALEYCALPDLFVATGISEAIMATDLHTAYGLANAVVTSGGFLRFNVLVLGTATGWTVTADLEELPG